MKKIIIIVAMIFVTVMANAHVFLFPLKHEKFGNTNLIVNTDKQTIRWMSGIVDIVNIKYSKVCSDNPTANNGNMTNYEKVANMQYFFYSSNLPTPKSIKASLEDIVKGKYGEGCIITINGVILFFKDKNEGKIIGVNLDRRDQKEYIETFADFMLRISGITPSSTNPQTSSSTKPSVNCPDSNHPHAIDLGLPSGTKWACCNVGASKPEGYGGYFAWGETSTKSNYTKENYLNGRGVSYNIGENIAGTQYDAAAANWGSQWVMPSLEQIQELMNKCTSEDTTQNGVNGCRFTGPNGASVFLPAAGHYMRGDYHSDSAGWKSSYWSSTLFRPLKSAWTLDFASGLDVHTAASDCAEGQSVRPVCNN